MFFEWIIGSVVLVLIGGILYLYNYLQLGSLLVVLGAMSGIAAVIWAFGCVRGFRNV